MKKPFFLTIILFLFFFGVIAFSQAPEFNVLAKSGEVFLKTKTSKNWEKIKIKEKIFDGYKIKINQGGYLSLIHKNGGTLELKPNKTTEYTVAQLTKNLSSKKSGLSKRFAKYVVDEITSTDDIMGSNDYRNNMDEVGAVERAMEGDVNTKKKMKNLSGTDEKTSNTMNVAGSLLLGGDNKFIVPRMPRSSYILEPNVDFTWYKLPDLKIYTFNLTTNNDSVVYKQRLNDTTISLNFQNLKLNKGMCYYWFVTDEDDDYKSEENCVYWLTDKQAKEVRDTISLINQEFDEKNSPMEQIYLAAFFEDRNLMNMAESAYKKACQLAPSVSDYKSMYARYLRRIGLYEEANNINK